jgi:hypothetical protein
MTKLGRVGLESVTRPVPAERSTALRVWRRVPARSVDMYGPGGRRGD